MPTKKQEATKKKREFLQEARDAGYRIQHEDDGTVRITKDYGPWKKQYGIRIHPDGTAFDITVDLSVAKGLRSYRDMRRVLCISED